MTKKVLIVEDERIAAEDIKNKIKEMGLIPLPITATGEEAVELAKNERPDLIIMDIKLQGKISGLNAAKEIRRFCNVPIIFITALADMLAKDNLKKEKNIVCLSKPFSNIEFTGHIKKFLNL